MIETVGQLKRYLNLYDDTMKLRIVAPLKISDGDETPPASEFEARGIACYAEFAPEKDDAERNVVLLVAGEYLGETDKETEKFLHE